MSIVARIVFFTFSIALGVGQGFQPVSAYNYGAKKYSRIREGYRFTAILMAERYHHCGSNYTGANVRVSPDPAAEG